MKEIRIRVEELPARAAELTAGDRVLLSGTVYTSRDAAHKRIMAAMAAGERLPYELKGAAVYYAGPTATKPGMVIGSCGPTTSSRMDGFAPRLLDLGLKVMIGKGERDAGVKEAIVRNGAVYLCAVGGAGALIAKCIKSADVIAFDELGCESIKRMRVEKLPLTVAVDCRGNDIFKR